MSRLAQFRLAAALGLLSPLPLAAQTAITSIATTTTDLADTVNYNGGASTATFRNTTVAITSFNAANGNNYLVGASAVEAYVRRNSAGTTPNGTSLWYSQDTSSATNDFRAAYETTVAGTLLGNNILRGSDNTFANAPAGSNSGDIERLDFIFSDSGITATNDLVFAIFDRGAIGVHDSVKIAVITGWDAAGNAVTQYSGNLVGITSTNYGTANVTSDASYNLFRYNSADNLTSWTSNTETGSQGIGGVVVTLADLGIAAGTTIYGYSLMGYDVTNGGSMSNLLDVTNTTYFPTATTNATGTGGIDLAAVNGTLFSRNPAPEPATYGALLLSACVGLGLHVRRRRARR